VKSRDLEVKSDRENSMKIRMTENKDERLYYF
jgi:hypothetical protein